MDWNTPFDRCKHLHVGKSFPNQGDGHNAKSLHARYRMMFLKGVHVTKAGPDRIFPRIIKTLEDNPETYNRDRVIHTNRNRDVI